MGLNKEELLGLFRTFEIRGGIKFHSYKMAALVLAGACLAGAETDDEGDERQVHLAAKFYGSKIAGENDPEKAALIWKGYLSTLKDYDIHTLEKVAESYFRTADTEQIKKKTLALWDKIDKKRGEITEKASQTKTLNDFLSSIDG